MRRPDLHRLKQSHILDTRANEAKDQAIEYIDWLERLFEELTPPGSEFVQNPQACSDYVRIRLQKASDQKRVFAQQSEARGRSIVDRLTHAINGHLSSLAFCAPELSAEKRMLLYVDLMRLREAFGLERLSSADAPKEKGSKLYQED